MIACELAAQGDVDAAEMQALEDNGTEPPDRLTPLPMARLLRRAAG